MRQPYPEGTVTAPLEESVLPLQHRIFLEAMLMLHREPERLRSPALLSHWLESLVKEASAGGIGRPAPKGTPEPDSRREAEHGDDPSFLDILRHPSAPAVAAAPPVCLSMGTTSEVTPPAEPRVDLPASNEARSSTRISIHQRDADIAPAGGSPLDLHPCRASGETPLETQAVQSRRLALQIASEATLSMATGHGGVFYLINLGLFLGFYSDFTSPRDPGLELPIWDFLALLGDRLCGSSLREDRVWEFLARLSNRDPEVPPGNGLLLPDDPGSPGPSCLLPCDQWIDRRLPSIRERLQRALGMADPENLASLLFRRFARIECTDTHLDLFFGLEDHPVEIRLSGLDRDPGWVPRAGRYVAFHYE
jgi:hypothetical protein